MLTEADARALVSERIANFGEEGPASWTPTITRVQPFSRGWLVFYGPAEQDVSLAGNAPFLVDSATGAVLPTGTAMPVEHYIENYLRTGDPQG